MFTRNNCRSCYHKSWRRQQKEKLGQEREKQKEQVMLNQPVHSQRKWFANFHRQVSISWGSENNFYETLMRTRKFKTFLSRKERRVEKQRKMKQKENQEKINDGCFLASLKNKQSLAEWDRSRRVIFSSPNQTSKGEIRFPSSKTLVRRSKRESKTKFQRIDRGIPLVQRS